MLEVDGIGTRGGRGSRGAIASATFFAISFALILFDLLDGQPHVVDQDDQVRTLQIRDLLLDGQWFDLRYPFVAMPEAYVSHYSRIVDFFYFVIAKAASPWLGNEGGLTLAKTVWPLALLAIFSAIVVHVVRAISPRPLRLTDIAIVALVSCIGTLEFVPGRVDHHNFQLVAMMAMLAGTAGPARSGGLVVGLACAISIAIGLECLPYIASAFVGMTLAASCDQDRHVRRLVVAGATFACTAVPAAAASYGPSYIFETHCDTISAPWLLLIAGGGAILAIVPFTWPRFPIGTCALGIVLRLTSLAIPGCLLLAACFALYPECAGGHYGAVDPLSRTLWLDRISQEHSLIVAFGSGNVVIAALFALYCSVLAASSFGVWQAIREGKHEIAIVFAVALSSMALFFLLRRSLPFPGMFVPLFVPMALSLLRPQASGRVVQSRVARVWFSASVTSALLAVLILYATAPGVRPGVSVFDQIASDDCSGQSFAALGAASPGRVIAPTGIALPIIAADPRYAVASVPLHRAAPGMRRMLVAFTTMDPRERSAALAPFDYLAVCAQKWAVPDLDAAPLFTQLVGGENVHGFIPVANNIDSRFRLFRIDHPAL